MVSLAIFIFSGHNTDGKYFVTCNKLGFHCETAPKRIVFYIEKAKDGHITPVEVVEIIDFSCGSNHTVSTTSLWYVHSDWYYTRYAELAAKTGSLQVVLDVHVSHNFPITANSCWPSVAYMLFNFHYYILLFIFLSFFCSVCTNVICEYNSETSDALWMFLGSLMGTGVNRWPM